MTSTTEDLAKLDLIRAMEDLAAPACVIGKDGRFSWLNQAYLDLIGDTRGRPFLENVAPEHKQLSRTNFARKMVGKTTTVFDMTVLDRAGERLTLRITSAPLREKGKVVGILAIGIPLGQTPPRARSVLDDLTPRQQEVLRLLAEGLDTPEIARRLGVADETARNHIRALLRATGAHSRLEAVLMGFRHGVVAHNLTQPHQEDDPPASD